MIEKVFYWLRVDNDCNDFFSQKIYDKNHAFYRIKKDLKDFDSFENKTRGRDDFIEINKLVIGFEILLIIKMVITLNETALLK